MSLLRYKSHKIVYAAKIASVGATTSLNITNLVLDLPGEEQMGYGVDNAWIVKHTPSGKTMNALIGGYLVVYGDGYESWSPAEVFEAGYTLDIDSTS